MKFRLVTLCFLLGFLTPLHAGEDGNKRKRKIEGIRPMPAEVINSYNRAYREAQSDEYDTPVRLLEAYLPIYPISRAMSGKEGVCNVVITIDASGRAKNFEPDANADKKMCDHAIYALNYWRFEPAKLEGEPVETQFRLPFSYTFKQ